MWAHFTWNRINGYRHFKYVLNVSIYLYSGLFSHRATTLFVFQERKGTAKLDFLRKIELEMQEKWEKAKAFEKDAATTVGESTK